MCFGRPSVANKAEHLPTRPKIARCYLGFAGFAPGNVFRPLPILLDNPTGHGLCRLPAVRGCIFSGVSTTSAAAPGNSTTAARIEAKGGSMALEANENAELVKVFDTEQESEAMVVQGLLESAGIESLISAVDNPQEVLPVGGVIIRVQASQADEALSLIQDYRNNAASDAEFTEEPTA
jgi:hypothetical protein